MISLSFVLASLALLLTPGPTNTLLAAAGAAGGFRSAMHLPLAEALGYLLAITVFHLAASQLADIPAAEAVLKLCAALWLGYSAAQLWREPASPAHAGRRTGFGAVLITTLLNPKAMLVGTVLIPQLAPGAFLPALASFVLLSLAAGAAWAGLGATVPASYRKHSYKGAALILACFAISVAAATVRQ